MSDLSFVEGLLSTTRAATGAGPVVESFVKSGELYQVVEATGGFLGKDAKSIKMALDNARQRVHKSGELEGKPVVDGGFDVTVRINQETNGKKGKDKVVLSEQVVMINKKIYEAEKAKSTK